jgi:hypothetical protein
VTVLFDAADGSPSELGANVLAAGSSSNSFNPETLALAGLTIGSLGKVHRRVCTRQGTLQP